MSIRPSAGRLAQSLRLVLFLGAGVLLLANAWNGPRQIPARVHLSLLSSYSRSVLGSVDACPAPAPGTVSCMAQAATVNGSVFHPDLATAAISGYTPADIQSAYRLNSSAGAGQTVAIIDSYDNATAEADLTHYRSQFGLPACTTSNGCFRKIDQNGGTSYPSTNSGWAEEIALDLDAVSAACPKCSILLVEAANSNYSDLLTAVDTAIAQGATEVSMSWGSSEFGTEVKADAHFNHPGVAFTAAAGDDGYGASWPASSPYITSVGGTTLQAGPGARGWSETVWSGTGSGCSAYESKPSWQTDLGCPRRTMNDIAAVADPETGLAVYDSGAGGWTVFGGTSLSTPIIAGTYADAGGVAVDSLGAGSLYGGMSLNDVTAGNDGTCSGAYLCAAAAGYDGPTGMGTPNGAFGTTPAPTPTPTATPGPHTSGATQLSPHSWDSGLYATGSSDNTTAHAWGLRRTSGFWGAGQVNYQAGATTAQRLPASGSLTFAMNGTYCTKGQCTFGSGSGYKGLVQFWNGPGDYVAFGLIHDPGISPHGMTVMIEGSGALGASFSYPVGGYWKDAMVSGASHTITATWDSSGISFTLDHSTTLGPYPVTMSNPSVSFLGAARNTGDINDVTFTNISFT